MFSVHHLFSLQTDMLLYKTDKNIKLESFNQLHNSRDAHKDLRSSELLLAKNYLQLDADILDIKIPLFIHDSQMIKVCNLVHH